VSHKAGHIIVQKLVEIPTLTTDQRATLEEIDQRDQYTLQDRLAIGMIVFQVADDDID
jgi:hypothetical protein